MSVFRLKRKQRDYVWVTGVEEDGYVIVADADSGQDVYIPPGPDRRTVPVVVKGRTVDRTAVRLELARREGDYDVLKLPGTKHELRVKRAPAELPAGPVPELSA